MHGDHGDHEVITVILWGGRCDGDKVSIQVCPDHGYPESIDVAASDTMEVSTYVPTHVVIRSGPDDPDPWYAYGLRSADGKVSMPWRAQS